MYSNKTYRYNSTIIRTYDPEKNVKYKKSHLSFNFSIILQNGHFRLDFSETFLKLEDLWTGGRNFTLLNEIRHKILVLNFSSELEYELKNTNNSHLIPTIEDWKFVNHT